VLRAIKYIAAILALILSCTMGIHAQANIISSNRYTSNWSGSGVIGGIPDASWTQCGSTIAAYTGSGSTITSALAACGANHYVLLGPGTFTINSGGITFPTTGHVALRGSGANSTFIVIASGAGASGCQLGSCLITATSADTTYGGDATFYGWTAGYSKGSNSLTFSSTTNINTTNPTLLFLEQCETGYTAASPTAACTGAATDNSQMFVCSALWTSTGVGCSNNGPGNEEALRGHFEMTYATNIAGSVVTIGDPLIHPDWQSGQTPRVWYAQPINTVGVENLSIDDSSAATNDIIQAFNAINFWVSGCRLTNMSRWAVELFEVEHSTVQNNYFYHSTGADSYGIRQEIGSENLFENNIIVQVFAPIVLDGASSGDVIAYNFIENDNYQSDFMRGSGFGHDVNDFELWEGNVGNSYAGGDGNHGTANMATFYRNFVLGWDSCANGQCGSTTFKDSATGGIYDAYGDRYGNFVANVVGTPGYTTKYVDQTGNFTPAVAFEFGFPNVFPADPLVYSTALMWGNWDVATGTVRFCGNSSDTGWSTTCASTSEVPTGAAGYPNSVPTKGDTGIGQGALPASFYLSSKPSWFGSLIWPPIGPDVSSGNVGQCSGTLNTPGQQAGMPATASGQCTGTSLATAYAGHVNANPAMNCYLNAMGGRPDGTGPGLVFNPASCYGASAPQAATPTFSPSPGTYASPQNVTISTTSSGAVICWNTTGSPSTNGSSGCAGGSTLYSGAIGVSSTETIFAVAGGTGYTDSSVASGQYVISSLPQATMPTFSPPPSTYTSSQNVTISTTSSGAVICWNTTGSPRTNGSSGCAAGSTLYSGAIGVSFTETIYAVAGGTGYTDSSVASAQYVINSSGSSAFSILTDGATITWPASSPNAEVTLGGNRTLLITGATSGWSGKLIAKQDATGSRTLALPSHSYVNNAGAGAIALTSTANAQDKLTVIYDGTNYYWNYNKNYTTSGGGGGTTHTFSQVQSKNSGFNCGSSSASCSLSVSAVGSGNAGVIVVVYGSTSSVTINSISGGGTWNLNPGTSSCFNSSHHLGTATAWIGSLTGGASTITVNTGTAPTSGYLVYYFEYAYTPSDGGVVLDSATSTPNNGVNPIPGATPTISGTSDVITQVVSADNNQPTAISAGYGNLTPVGDSAMANLLNTTSVTVPNWTVSGSNDACSSQEALK